MGFKKIDKKVFSRSDMPPELQAHLDEHIGNLHYRVGKYYETDVYGECYNGTEDYVKVKEEDGGEVIWRDDEPDSKMIIIRGNDIISDWLLDNGGEFWEEVLIEL